MPLPGQVFLSYENTSVAQREELKETIENDDRVTLVEETETGVWIDLNSPLDEILPAD